MLGRNVVTTHRGFSDVREYAATRFGLNQKLGRRRYAAGRFGCL